MTLPGAFDWLYRFDKPMRGRTGDHRVTGSIAYELVLLARGVTQYMYTSHPHLWDVAGGVAVAMEAGASVMVGSRKSGPLGLLPSMEWTESSSLVESWDERRHYRTVETLGEAASARKSAGRPVRVGQFGMEAGSGDGDGDGGETDSASGKAAIEGTGANMDRRDFHRGLRQRTLRNRRKSWSAHRLRYARIGQG